MAPRGWDIIDPPLWEDEDEDEDEEATGYTPMTCWMRTPQVSTTTTTIPQTETAQ
jgi:hypothetical protein